MARVVLVGYVGLNTNLGRNRILLTFCQQKNIQHQCFMMARRHNVESADIARKHAIC